MASRDVQRAFNKLQATVAKVQDVMDPEHRRQKAEQEAQKALQEQSGPITAQDCVPRIMQAWKDKDYFKLLGLPAVDVDALGRPTWECSDKDVSRAYRQLSVLVHPDKKDNRDNPDSREAFERLNEAHRILNNPGKLADEMNRHLEAARARRAAAEAGASLSERVALNAARNQQAQALRQTEQQQVAGAVLAQARQRREAVKRKQESRLRSQPRPEDDEDGAAAAAGSTDGEGAGAQAKAQDSEDEDAEHVQHRLARMRNSKKSRRR